MWFNFTRSFSNNVIQTKKQKKKHLLFRFPNSLMFAYVSRAFVVFSWCEKLTEKTLLKVSNIIWKQSWYPYWTFLYCTQVGLFYLQCWYDVTSVILTSWDWIADLNNIWVLAFNSFNPEGLSKPFPLTFFYLFIS